MGESDNEGMARKTIIVFLRSKEYNAISVWGILRVI